MINIDKKDTWFVKSVNSDHQMALNVVLLSVPSGLVHKADGCYGPVGRECFYPLGD